MSWSTTPASPPWARCTRSDRDAELAMVRTNVEAVVDLCTLFIPGMVDPRRGAILNTASTAAFQPLPGTGRLRRLQGVRALLRSRARRRAQGHRRHRDHAVPRPGGDRVRRGGRMSDEEAGAALPEVHVGPGGPGGPGGGGRAGGRSPVVIPGAANRVGAAAGHLIPNSWILPILAKRHPGAARLGTMTPRGPTGRRARLATAQHRRVGAARGPGRH